MHGLDAIEAPVDIHVAEQRPIEAGLELIRDEEDLVLVPGEGKRLAGGVVREPGGENGKRLRTMADTRTPEQRRHIMQSVGTRDTGPEMTVRQVLSGLGYRYRLHAKKLPGKPDIVFPGRKKAIFVHGCYWHNHGCSKGQAPKSRLDYWGPKLKANRERDAARVVALEALGWAVLTVWQCETTATDALAEKLTRFVESAPESRRSLRAGGGESG